LTSSTVLIVRGYLLFVTFLMLGSVRFFSTCTENLLCRYTCDGASRWIFKFSCHALEHLEHLKNILGLINKWHLINNGVLWHAINLLYYFFCLKCQTALKHFTIFRWTSFVNESLPVYKNHMMTSCQRQYRR